MKITDNEGNSIQIDFNTDLEYRRQIAGPKSELISKAMGGHKKGLHVVDLTSGLAIDTITLARLGYEVLSIERNPKIAELLVHAHQNWQSPLKEKIKFVQGESSEIICHLAQNGNSKFKLAYFDPMFPRKKKSALPKQEIVVLQKLTNEDPDSQGILKKIISFNLESKQFNRIVIKRPIDADPIVKPTSTLKGKLIRYDIIDFNW